MVEADQIAIKGELGVTATCVDLSPSLPRPPGRPPGGRARPCAAGRRGTRTWTWESGKGRRAAGFAGDASATGLRVEVQVVYIQNRGNCNFLIISLS